MFSRVSGDRGKSLTKKDIRLVFSPVFFDILAKESISHGVCRYEMKIGGQTILIKIKI